MPRSLLPALLIPTLLLGCHRDPRPLLNGRVEAYLSDLGPRVAGRLVQVYVKEGQRVKAGQLLARISADELDAAVARDLAGYEGAEAKRVELDRGSRTEDIAQGEARVHDASAALKLAEVNLHRTRKLAGEGVMAQAALDQAVSARDQAAANLNLQAKALAELKAGARIEEREAGHAAARQARAVLDQSRIQAGYLEVRAPFDAIIIHRLREPGTVLTAGQPILTVARLDALWVRFYLPQPLQAQAHLGMPLSVHVPGSPAPPIQTTLDQVSDESEFTPKMVESREERVDLVYAARADLPGGWDKGLVPGVAVDVRLGAPNR